MVAQKGYFALFLSFWDVTKLSMWFGVALSDFPEKKTGQRVVNHSFSEHLVMYCILTTFGVFCGCMTSIPRSDNELYIENSFEYIIVLS